MFIAPAYVLICNLFRKVALAAFLVMAQPTVYHHIRELQRNTNGKIDRLFYNNQVNG